MKAGDLMIGDWVNLNFDVDYKTGNQIYGYVQVTAINKDGTIDVNCTFDKSESMQDGWDLKLLKLIEPIPLTQEILEKNDFLVDSNGIFYLKENLKFGLKKDIDYGYWFINRADNYKEYICTCDFIHELQHLLKLCKIEKEIVL